jgi:hypothetical protein
MDTPNFGAILDRPANEIQRPKPLPVGTYVCVVVGLPREDKSTKKGTEFVEFTMRPIEASTDVDEDDLKAMGGLENKTLRVTFWLVEGQEWRLLKFLRDDLKIDAEDEDGESKSLRQMCSEVTNRQVLAYVKHQASDDGTTTYAQVGTTAPVE